MAAGSRVRPTSAVICDTGALLDYLVSSSPDHALFRQAIHTAQTRYVPGLVLAEVDYFLREERGAMRRFIRDLTRGAFTYAALPVDHLRRAMETDERYGDLGLGLVDASIVTLAEDLGLRRILTRDIRHFSAVRLRDGSAFEFAAFPTDAERS